MDDDDLDDAGMLIGRIDIELRMLPNGEMIHFVESVDAGEQPLPLVQALGLLELAKDTVIRGAMGQAPT